MGEAGVVCGRGVLGGCLGFGDMGEGPERLDVFERP